MKPLLFTLFSDGSLLQNLSQRLDTGVTPVVLHTFPDKESYIKLTVDPKDRICIIFETLNDPNSKIMPLLLLAETLRDLGAKKIGIITPYLAYMRQDQRFQPYEGITSIYFSKLLSTYFDWLITVDPHLHRIHYLNQIYSIPTHVVHATSMIGEWIRHNVNNPLLIGPDNESAQWIEQVAKNANAPYIILDKIRSGDQTVKVSLPQINNHQNCTPVLVDDIISTAKTMIEVIHHLQNLKMKVPVCIGIHGIFADGAFDALLQAGAGEIITCNSITHCTNKIDLSQDIFLALQRQLSSESQVPLSE